MGGTSHTLFQRTSLTAAAADVATYFSKPPQSPLPKATEVTPKETNDQYEEINTEKSQDENTNPIEEDSKNSDKSPDKSETPKHVDSTNQKDTADATDNDRKQASTAVKNQDISDINTNGEFVSFRLILKKGCKISYTVYLLILYFYFLLLLALKCRTNTFILVGA